jgi:hypothetical protein
VIVSAITQVEKGTEVQTIVGTSDQFTEAQRKQIAMYARHISLRDLHRFSDLQLYTYFSMYIDHLIKQCEKATNTTLDDHVDISSLMYDFFTIAEGDPLEDAYEWITKYDNVGAFARIIRETLEPTTTS